MTCPRCGAPTPADATTCERCGLSRVSYGRGPGPGLSTAYGAWPPPMPRPSQQARWGSSQPPGPWPSPAQHPGAPPRWVPTPYGYSPVTGVRPPRPPLREGVVRAACLGNVLAALACLVHGVGSVTWRRAVYVDLARGEPGFQSNDVTNGVLLTIASVASLLAFVLALLVLSRRRGWTPVSGVGLALAAVGWLVVLVGAALVAGAETRIEAPTAAFAAVVVGVGFVAVAAGHGLLAGGLRAPEREGFLATAPYPGPDPYVGTALARDPCDRPSPAEVDAYPGDS